MKDELISDHVFDRPPTRRVPAWAHQLVETIVEDNIPKATRRQLRSLKLRMVSPRRRGSFGGRWFPSPDESPGGIGIAFFEHDDEDLMLGVLVHEVGHYLQSVLADDQEGLHDARFLALAKRLYRTYGVTDRVARLIERHHPEAARWRWCGGRPCP